ncbi:hypothetical protein ACFL6G_10195, partial [candidate division KSB1 bacterium]
MPPSGFKKKEVENLLAFLESCSKALKEQSIISQRAPISALQSECNNIEMTLNDDDITFSKIILELTYLFYKRLLDMSPEDFDQYDNLVQ